MGLYSCVVLLLVQDSIPVAGDIPEEEGNPAAEDTPVVEGNLEEGSLVVEEDIPVVESNLAVTRTPAVDTLEVAFVAQPYLIGIARVDQDLSHAFLLLVVQVIVLLLVVLLVAVQVMVLLLVVQLAVPGCPCVSSPNLTLVNCLQENCDWHGFHRQ